MCINCKTNCRRNLEENFSPNQNRLVIVRMIKCKVQSVRYDWSGYDWSGIYNTSLQFVYLENIERKTVSYRKTTKLSNDSKVR